MSCTAHWAHRTKFSRTNTHPTAPFGAQCPPAGAADKQSDAISSRFREWGADPTGPLSPKIPSILEALAGGHKDQLPAAGQPLRSQGIARANPDGENDG
ncbi:hypothetical protein [Cognatiyoonia sp. IB215182]|uniref:hypothetical protein n=1 Tax=Cognatiyoonia sp. IB215182 TaxID=3097353 RepID=UPI002A10294F|nr:hypothetical protein [Cognatiyoonia sp. IB215182]MDX8355296.1 hypothetical protein [Cognatiyoonia sp. IB215182]